MNNIYLSEAFKRMDALDEDIFEVDKDGLTALKDFEDSSDEDDSITVVDPDAEDEEELEDSYIGKVILDCSVCHTDIYKNKDEIVIDDETDLANVGEECPYCYSSEGFKIIGEVKPFVETEIETEDEEDEDDDEEVEKNESLRRNRRLKESCSINQCQKWVDYDMKKYKKISNDTMKKIKSSGYSVVKDQYGDYEVIADRKDESLRRHKKMVESISRKSRKFLTEAPVYGLEPRYDSRKSFYGKAQVDTGDNGDKNKLYSYGTLVAEIKDGKPVVYGTYSATTLRHIKDWLKQNGFKAETSRQILADYGVKDESCNGKKSIKESSGEVFHNENGLDYTVVERSRSGKNALLNRGKQWIIAWNCPQNNEGSWGQGHYFFDEDEAREWWNKKYIKESKISNKSLKEGWRGTPVKLVSHGSWGDPDLVWNGYTFNYWDIEDAMWSMFLEETGYKDSDSNNPNVEKEFDAYVQDNFEGYLDDVIYGGYFDEGSKSWHDRYKRESLRRKSRNMKESMDVHDLSRDQLIELKQNYMVELADNGEFAEVMGVDYDNPSYRDMADADKLISDEDIFRHYDGYTFTEDDFFESLKSRKPRKMKESIEDITIDTGDQEISVSTRDKEPESKDEMIAPLSDDVKTDIEMGTDRDTVDVDIDEFSEEDFDELGESYLKKVYENVEGYKTISAKSDGNKLYLEGLIKFNSGKEKKTSFVFESKTITKKGRAKLIGENLQISKGHKAFKLTGLLNNGKFISESLNYNYRVKNSSGESQRIYGTSRKSK